MPDYDREELQRLIAKYQNDLMKQYPKTVKEDVETNEILTEDIPLSAPASSQTVLDSDVGSLQVRVSTENRAVPLPGAVVTVTRTENGETSLVRTMITDESGLTPLIDLATKERTLSLSPGDAQPFLMYTVDVVADGYYPKRFVSLPIYGGVTAVQSVSMIPLPEGGDNDVVLIYPQGAPSIT